MILEIFKEILTNAAEAIKDIPISSLHSPISLCINNESDDWMQTFARTKQKIRLRMLD